MPFPAPIVPVTSRADVPEPAPPAPAPVDEGLREGALRRAHEFVADMRRPEQALPWIVIALLTAALTYSYWPGLMNARSSWDNPQYQHGWIVPVFTVLLLFWWRRPVTTVTDSARLAGLGLLAGSFLLRLLCANYRIVTIDMYTFVPALAGVFLLAGGWGMFRWAWAPIAALIFMYPLPDEATRYLLGPLQRWATVLSTLELQTLGIDAYRDGNRIDLGGGQVLGVVDACSGLKMLTIFVWLAAMLMLVGGLQWWENLVIAVFAIPIAIFVNSVRITAAGVLYHFDKSLQPLAEMLTRMKLVEEGHSLAEGFHDSMPAALMMMVLAVGLLVLLMKILSYLVVTEDFAPTVVTATARAPIARAPASVGPVAAVPMAPRGSGAFPALPRTQFAEKRPAPRPPESGPGMS